MAQTLDAAGIATDDTDAPECVGEGSSAQGIQIALDLRRVGFDFIESISGAILAYREEAGGVRVIDAKRAVDALLIHARMRALLASGVSELIASLIAQEQTTQAARAYRIQTGGSRREAKAIIEAMRVEDWTGDRCETHSPHIPVCI